MKLRKGLLVGFPLLVITGLAIHGIAGRERALTALKRVSQEQATPPVEIIVPRPGPAARILVLPGTVRAWYEAPIFAQVAGYVRSWNEDYGASVKAGQLLARIDTPSLDAQYAAAQASLRVALANYQLAVTTAARWQALAKTPAVSQQDVDVQVATAAARKAELEVARQNVARFKALEAFKRVVAPFDGVVTARLTDVGSYVTAAGGDAGAQSNSTQLFTVADVHKLRVFVEVPEDYADALAPGLSAILRLPSHPDDPIDAQYLTTARAFSPNTRTAVTELTVTRPDIRLWPGTYVDVEFRVPTDPSILTIPEQSLIFRALGSQVAVVDAQNTVHFHQVTLGQNLGQIVQVVNGLSAEDRLVNNPPAALVDGQRVEPVTPMIDQAAAPAKPKPVSARGSATGDGHTP